MRDADFMQIALTREAEVKLVVGFTPFEEFIPLIELTPVMAKLELIEDGIWEFRCPTVTFQNVSKCPLYLTDMQLHWAGQILSRELGKKDFLGTTKSMQVENASFRFKINKKG